MRAPIDLSAARQRRSASGDLDAAIGGFFGTLTSLVSAGETLARAVASAASVQTIVTEAAEVEPFVDAERVGEFLAVPANTVRLWVRDGKLPAHTMAHYDPAVAPRHIRFRLSEVAAAYTRFAGSPVRASRDITNT